MVSAYLGSPYQLLSRSTFLALGCTLTFLGLGFLGRIAPSVWAKISAPLLIVAIVGFLGVAGAPQAARLFGIPTQPATVVSILLLSDALRHEPGWRPVSGILVAIGALLVALFLLTVVLGVSISMGLGGLANRVVLTLICERAWPSMSFAVRRRFRGAFASTSYQAVRSYSPMHVGNWWVRWPGFSMGASPLLAMTLTNKARRSCILHVAL